MALSKTRWLFRGLLILIIAAILGVGLLAWRRQQPEYLWAMARQSVAAQDDDRAAIYLQSLLQRQPEHVEAMLELSELRLREDRAAGGAGTYASDDSALRLLVEAARLRPDDVALQIKLMEAQRDSLRLRDTITAAQNVLRLDAGHEAALALESLSVVAKTNRPLAQTLLRQISEGKADGPWGRLVVSAHVQRASEDQEALQATLEEAFATAERTSDQALCQMDTTQCNALLSLLYSGVVAANDTTTTFDRAARLLNVVDRLAGQNDLPDQTETVGVVARVSERLRQINARDETEVDVAWMPRRYELLSRAEAILAEAIVDNTADAAVYHEAALLALERGDEARALDHLQRGIAQLNDNSDRDAGESNQLRLLAARQLMQAGRLVEAAQQVPHLKRDPQTAGWADLIAAAVASAQGKHEVALNHLDGASKQLGEILPVRLLLARSLVALGHWREADQQWTALADMYKSLDDLQRDSFQNAGIDAAGLHYRQAQIKLALGDVEAALPHVAALSNTPLKSQAVRLLFEYHWGQRQTAGAITWLASERNFHPDDVALVVAQASALTQRGHREEGQRLLRDFVTTHPEELFAQVALLHTWIDSGEVDRALKQIESLVQAEPNRPELRLIQAHVLAVAGQLDEARQLVDPLTQVEQTRTAARLLLAELNVRSHDLEAAATLLRSIESEVTQTSDAPWGAMRLLQGQLEAAQGDYAQAAATLASSLPFTQVKGQAQSALLQALRAYAQQSGQQQAAQLSQKLLEQYPDEPILLLATAETTLAQRQFERSLVILERLRKQLPDEPTVPFLFAQVWYAQHEFTRAETELTRSLELDPAFVPALCLSAEVAWIGQHTEAALQRARAALAQDAELPSMRLLEARAVYALGNRKLAIEKLDQLIESRPELVAPYVQLASWYEDADQHEAALETIRRGREHLSESTSLVAAEIEILTRAGQHALAQSLAQGFAAEATNAADQLAVAAAIYRGGNPQEAYQLGLRLLPDAGPEDLEVAHWLLGTISFQAGLATGDAQQFQRAQKHFETVLELNPHHFGAGNNLAWIHDQRSHDLPTALGVAERVRGDSSVASIPVELIDTLASLYRRTGRLAEAGQLLDEALAIHPREALLHYQHGFVLLGVDRLGAARDAWHEALQQGLNPPQSEELRTELKNLEQRILAEAEAKAALEAGAKSKIEATTTPVTEAVSEPEATSNPHAPSDVEPNAKSTPDSRPEAGPKTTTDSDGDPKSTSKSEFESK